MPLEIGDVIDRKYRVTRLIGKGGMGSVYDGTHILVERRVAIKVLRPELERGQAMARFEQEARAAGRIGNEHILDVYDMGKLADGSPYLVAEYLDGETLQDRMNRLGRLSPSAAVPLLLQLLDGLGAAHDAGIVHRDLKPDNVFLVRKKAGHRDFVKLIDFGVSRFERADGDDGMRLTTTGAVVGTPLYLSPEQARGRRDVDARSDLFSVGIILYEMVTGETPFQAESFNDLLFKIVLEMPKPPEQVVTDLDPTFAGIMMKALAKDPADRFQSADEFGRALNRWAGGGDVLPSSWPPRDPKLSSLSVRAVSIDDQDATTQDDQDATTQTYPGGKRDPGVPPAPTPSTFGASQFAETTSGAPRRLTRRAIGVLAGVVAVVGLGVAVSLGRGAGPAAEASAGENHAPAAQSGERESPTAATALAPSASAGAEDSSVATPATAAAPSAKPRPTVAGTPARSRQAQTIQAPQVPPAASSASPPRRRRDYGY
jgi:serine/threonine-protein kinase